jgi:hypothetical protein
MAKRAKTVKKYSKNEATKRIAKVQATLRKLADELDGLHGNVEGAGHFDDIRLATTSWETKAVAFKLCGHPTTMSFFNE